MISIILWALAIAAVSSAITLLVVHRRPSQQLKWTPSPAAEPLKLSPEEAILSDVGFDGTWDGFLEAARPARNVEWYTQYEPTYAHKPIPITRTHGNPWWVQDYAYEDKLTDGTFIVGKYRPELPHSAAKRVPYKGYPEA